MIYAGLKVITLPHMVDRCEDFSRSRSPSRALRRWKKFGIRGHGIFERPSTNIWHDRANHCIVCHPAMFDQIAKMIAEKSTR